MDFVREADPQHNGKLRTRSRITGSMIMDIIDKVDRPMTGS